MKKLDRHTAVLILGRVRKNFEDCENVVKETIEKFGRIDVLVNNAGITKDMLLARMKEEDFKQVIDVNLVGTFNVTKNVISYMMKARSGRIINISSVVGISGNAGQSNYAASKAGIIGFTKSLAKEVASRNILVYAIAPGFIQTSMTDVLKDEIKEEIAKAIPLKRMGTADDVANLVKFLASEDSSYITGKVIPSFYIFYKFFYFIIIYYCIYCYIYFYSIKMSIFYCFF